MIRLFVAIDLPEAIKPTIGSMGGTIQGSRAVQPDQLHLTLKFIGEVDSARYLDIKDFLHTIRFPTLSMQLHGVGHFPLRGEPKVIWAGIKPVEEIIQLRNMIEKTLADVGISREKKKFTPHLTLCRLKHSPSKKVARFLMENAFFESPMFEVHEFKLYSSNLTKKGAIHTVEDIFQLSNR